MTLPVSRLIRVNVNLGPTAPAPRSFGILLECGDSNVINGSERIRTYGSLDEVGLDFSPTAPEFLGAQLYFGQSPKPNTLMIGRWLRTATAGELDGGILNSTEQLISNFTPITNGGFTISIDGASQTLTGLDFSAAGNLNAVAAIVNSSLSGGTFTWNGSQFVVKSSTTGAGVKASGTITCDTNPSYGVQASGTITIATNPSNGDSININGTTVTFVSSSPTGTQVLIAGTAALTAANLQTLLSGSANTGLAASTYNTIGTVTTVTARAYGTAGNSYVLTSATANVTVSGSGTLAGGVAPDTVTVNGTAVTFVASSPSGNQVLVGPTASATATNLNTFLANSTDGNINDATYSVSGQVVTVTYQSVGTAGNSFTLAKSSSHISLSGATLSGGTVGSSVSFATAPGSGTDISAQMKLTSSLALPLIPGYDAESPVECAAVMANLSSAWYGLTFSASVPPNNSQNLAVSSFIEGLDLSRIFGVTITDTGVLSAEVTTDLASQMKAANYLQSFCQYSANPYAICSFFGRAFSVNFAANRSTITLMYKQEPGVVAENLSTTQANTLQAKRCNVFVSYVNDTAIIQYGVMSGPRWFDETHGLDWFKDAVQNSVYTLLYTSTTKIPQTDSGSNQIVNSVQSACDSAVNNGLFAPGVWNGDVFGQLTQGQYLSQGYYIYAQPIAQQSQADRDARKAPPIQVAGKLAGAIQEADILVNINR